MEDPGHLLSQRRKRGRKPNKVQIQECFFPDCAKKYHPDIISLKNHLITKHLKKKIENHISKYSKNNNETRDSRVCPFKQCGFYAYFRGGAVKHYALAHNGLFKFLKEVSEEKGLYEDFKKLV